MRVRPIEDILADKYASPQSYRQLYSYLLRYLPTTDARHLAWHITIPQHIYQNSIASNRVTTIMPQSDQLHCHYCNSTLQIPMKYPRFNETTFKAYRSVYYTPQAPQECACTNLKTLTDRQGNLRVYLTDANEKSFGLFNGPIDLLKCSQSITEPLPIHNIFDSPRPTTQDPFSYEARSEFIVNHINLYRTSLHTQHTLLPTESTQSYARAYNLVVLGSKSIYFPTGHEVDYLLLPPEVFGTNINGMTYTADWLFRQAILTPLEVTQKNAFVNYLYRTVLPAYIDRTFQRHIARIERRLRIPRSYAPSAPIVPFLIHLNQQRPDNHIKRPIDDFRPLSVYRDLTILRLPRFKATYKTGKFDRQDFSTAQLASNTQVPNASYRTRKQHLVIIKNERIKALQYLLPRYPHGTAKLIHSHVLNTTNYTELPSHTQTNHTLLSITQR